MKAHRTGSLKTYMEERVLFWAGMKGTLKRNNSGVASRAAIARGRSPANSVQLNQEHDPKAF